MNLGEPLRKRYCPCVLWNYCLPLNLDDLWIVLALFIYAVCCRLMAVWWHSVLMDETSKQAIDRSVYLTNSLLTILQALCSRLADLLCIQGCSVCNNPLIKLITWSTQVNQDLLKALEAVSYILRKCHVHLKWANIDKSYWISYILGSIFKLFGPDYRIDSNSTLP